MTTKGYAMIEVSTVTNFSFEIMDVCNNQCNINAVLFILIHLQSILWLTRWQFKLVLVKNSQ